MPGMNSGLDLSDPTVVAAFKAALVHQGLIALLIFVLLGLAWITIRAGLPAAGAPSATASRARPRPPGPSRPGGGCCGSASARSGSSTGSCKPSRPCRSGCPSQVIEPTAATSPPWVQHVVNWAGTIWTLSPDAGRRRGGVDPGRDRPVAAGRAPRPLSRLAGLASVGWGLVVWVFGESFGGIFAPGLTWLFGAPGAALIYAWPAR